jgi:hypothetical protein
MAGFNAVTRAAGPSTDSQWQDSTQGDTADWLGAVNRGGLLHRVLDPEPYNGQGGPNAPHACQLAFVGCRTYAEQLHDRGYVPESSRLLAACINTTGLCLQNERTAQTWSGWFGLTTFFPPRVSGWVFHQYGRPPTYVPNPTAGASFLSNYPPK